MHPSADDAELTRLAVAVSRKDVVLWQSDESVEEAKEEGETPHEKLPNIVNNTIFSASLGSSVAPTPPASILKKKVRFFKNYGAIEPQRRHRSAEDDSVTILLRIRNIRALNQLTNACSVVVILCLLIVIIILILLRHE